jgi:hypothetical protein
MKSTEVYRVLREEIAPWAKAEGFRRGKSLLSWYRPSGELYLVFWFQVSQHGWDDYAGSEFVVEFQLSRSPEVGWQQLRRARLAHFLGADALKELQVTQNAVIRALPKPPSDYWILQDPRLRDWYLRMFEPVSKPFSPTDDVWLRYHAAADVTRWGQCVLRHLPECISEAASWG